MSANVITIPSDRQKALAQPLFLEGLEASPRGGASCATESIDHMVSLIEIEQSDWVKEVLDDGVVSMLNIQFDDMIADESDLSAM
jgi:hypothetical protein